MLLWLLHCCPQRTSEMKRNKSLRGPATTTASLISYVAGYLDTTGKLAQHLLYLVGLLWLLEDLRRSDRDAGYNQAFYKAVLFSPPVCTPIRKEAAGLYLFLVPQPGKHTASFPVRNDSPGVLVRGKETHNPGRNHVADVGENTSRFIHLLTEDCTVNAY